MFVLHIVQFQTRFALLMNSGSTTLRIVGETKTGTA